MSANETRLERDSLGEIAVPGEAYYGAQTMRAVINFPVSHLALACFYLVTWLPSRHQLAKVNCDLGLRSQYRQGD